MKKFLKLIFNSKIGRYTRDLIRFRPPIFLYDFEKNYIASDLFLWKTDNAFQTVFKASNILKKYYGIESILRIIFYNENGKQIIIKDYKFDGKTLNILITKNLTGIEGIGTFAAFNIPLNKNSQIINITNRCYIGYGRKKSFSMIHGNIIGLMTQNFTLNEKFEQSIVPAVTSKKRQYNYFIQKKIIDVNTNLYFTNPLNRKINININGKKALIDSKGCLNIFLEPSVDVINVKSDFIFSRPIIICDDGKFIDCHHA